MNLMPQQPLRKQLFTARMSTEELAMLHQLAQEDGISASDMVRQFVRRAYVERHGGLEVSKRRRHPKRNG